jgi:uncharacterized membrane protein YgdD (TMEM256/DUF423 family)
MNRQARLFLVIGALAMALAVALGAAASHALRERLAADAGGWFAIALQYHQLHALGLMIVGLAAARSPSRWFIAAGWLLIGGLLLFSGNLYLRSLLGIHELRALTPYGGMAFIGGWLCVVIGALRGSRTA